MTSPPIQWRPGANGDAIVKRRENRPVSATSSAEASLAMPPSNFSPDAEDKSSGARCTKTASHI